MLHILFFYKFFLNSMFFHLRMNSTFIRPSTLIREVRRVPKWVFYNFHPITYVVLSMRSCKRLWCTLAGPALAIAECLLDESADYFISGQILELQLEILRVHLISREIKHYRAMDIWDIIMISIFCENVWPKSIQGNSLWKYWHQKTK